ncbi:unnamed protein product [Peniophora sp. CBMAI 1063]|nr:unnamed protein product [Peniophora sp. CBMAI 1063]
MRSRTRLVIGRVRAVFSVEYPSICAPVRISTYYPEASPLTAHREPTAQYDTMAWRYTLVVQYMHLWPVNSALACCTADQHALRKP